MVVMLAASLLSGCTSTSSVDTPIANATESNPTSNPTTSGPDTSIQVTTGDNFVKITGGSTNNVDVVSPKFKLGLGTYIVQKVSTGKDLICTVYNANSDHFPTFVHGKAPAEAGLPSLIMPMADENELMEIVADEVAESGSNGEYTVHVLAGSPWTVQISRPDTSQVGTLPITVTGKDGEYAISNTFMTSTSKIDYSYQFNKEFSGEAADIRIFDVNTGERLVDWGWAIFPGRGIKGEGDLIDFPTSGVYIIGVYFPKGSGGGTVTFSPHQ